MALFENDGKVMRSVDAMADYVPCRVRVRIAKNEQSTDFIRQTKVGPPMMEARFCIGGNEDSAPETMDARANRGDQVFVRYSPKAAENAGIFRKMGAYALAGICYAAIFILIWVANACISWRVWTRYHFQPNRRPATFMEGIRLKA